MPNDNDLPGSALPLDPAIQDAIDYFNQPTNKYQAIRAAAALVLFQDLVEDIRKILKNRNGGN
jgi:hypothetical protein